MVVDLASGQDSRCRGLSATRRTGSGDGLGTGSLAQPRQPWGRSRRRLAGGRFWLAGRPWPSYRWRERPRSSPRPRRTCGAAVPGRPLGAGNSAHVLLLWPAYLRSDVHILTQRLDTFKVYHWTYLKLATRHILGLQPSGGPPRHAQAHELEQELDRELQTGTSQGTHHQRSGRTPTLEGHLFRLTDTSEWALVHLAWRSETDPRWPSAFVTSTGRHWPKKWASGRSGSTPTLCGMSGHSSKQAPVVSQASVYRVTGERTAADLEVCGQTGFATTACWTRIAFRR